MGHGAGVPETGGEVGATRPPIGIVIVDDHHAMRRLTRLWIEQDPRFVVVGEAATGLGGINLVTEEQPDVVLLDVAMPQMDGLSSIPFLRSASPRTVIAVHTNHYEYGLLGLKKGAAAVFDKGDPMSEVLDGLVKLVDAA